MKSWGPLINLLGLVLLSSYNKSYIRPLSSTYFSQNNLTIMSLSPPPWKLTIDDLLATKKYNDALLANKVDPILYLNKDRTIRPSKRYEPDSSEKRVLLVGQIPNVSPGLKMGIQGNRNTYPGRYVRLLCYFKRSDTHKMSS